MFITNENVDQEMFIFLYNSFFTDMILCEDFSSEKILPKF